MTRRKLFVPIAAEGGDARHVASALGQQIEQATHENAGFNLTDVQMLPPGTTVSPMGNPRVVLAALLIFEE